MVYLFYPVFELRAYRDTDAAQTSAIDVFPLPPTQITSKFRPVRILEDVCRRGA